MAKSLDPELLVKTFLKVAQQVFESTSGKVVPSDDPTSKVQNIIEYQGRLSASGMDKFNAPAYVAGVSFFSSEQDRDKHRAKGAMVLYLEALNADKFFKGFGHPVADEDDEDEASLACGKICTLLAEKFRNNLADSGLSSLVLSNPVCGKNSLSEGVDFSSDQKQKQEISFYFWKKKSMVVDLTFAEISR